MATKPVRSYNRKGGLRRTKSGKTVHVKQSSVKSHRNTK